MTHYVLETCVMFLVLAQSADMRADTPSGALALKAPLHSMTGRKISIINAKVSGYGKRPASKTTIAARSDLEISV